jgi:hypothetical protein
MLSRRSVLSVSALIACVLLLWWWSSSGYSTKAQICEQTNSRENCTSHNILFALAWNVAKEFDHWSTLITALATVAIGYFTLTLKQSSDKMWRISERALTELEAPFVSIKINSPGLEVKGAILTFGILKYCVANYGRTSATILEHFEKVEPVEIGKGYPPKINLTKDQGSLMPYGVIAPPNGQCDHDFPFIPVGQFITENPRSPKSSIFFLGFVRYENIFSNRFVLGFCFEFDRNSNRWILTGNNEYNYCRKEA